MSTSTIEVVKSLNPLYYSFPKLTNSTEYKIFKNLNTKIVINLEEELIKEEFKPDNKNPKHFGIDTLSDDYKENNEVKIDKIRKILIEEISFLESLKTEKDTVFILLDGFEKNSQIIYKDNILSQIYKEFYSTSNESSNRKNKFTIRVYNKNRDIKDESIKEIINMDIKNIIKEIQNYHSRSSSFREFKKIRYITNFDGKLDYFTLNVDSIKIRKDIKKIKEYVNYADQELIKSLKTTYDKIDFDGKIIGKIEFYINPTVSIPHILNKNYEIDELSIMFNAQNMDSNKRILRRIKIEYENRLIEFKRYISNLDSKIDNEEKIISSKFNKNEIYELYMMLGVNGNGLINLTKEKHDKNFRYKKNSGIILEFDNINKTVIGYVSHQKPNSFWVIYVTDSNKNVIVTMDIKIEYTNTKNIFTVMDVYDLLKHKSLSKGIGENGKLIPKDEKVSELLSEENKKKFMDYFKFSNGESKSKLINYKGILTRKTLSPKNLIYIEPLNLTNTGINKKFYIYPLITLTDEAINKYFKNNKYSYEDLLNIFINQEKMYEFYIFISTNYPSYIYDTEKYSQTIKLNKIEENTKFIIDKLLEKKKVFRPKKLLQDKKDFKGIYKIMKHEVSKILTIDEKINPDKNKPKTVDGVCIVLDSQEKQERQLKPGVTKIQSNDGVSLYNLPKKQTETPRCGEKSDLGREGSFKVSSVFKEKGDKIIRANVKLYITQNNIDKVGDINCLVRREELKKSFFSLFDGFSTKKDRKLGNYLS